ncbi:MAG: hypothetical protein KIY11_07610 [Thermoplasmata archaeon]|nr:hypothetical protein [Candidatus Sysuiplasma acidicola]
MKRKTSICVDTAIWSQLKSESFERKIDVGELLQRFLEEGLLTGLDSALEKRLENVRAELDFEPIKLKEQASKIVREMRDKRSESVLGQQRHN